MIVKSSATKRHIIPAPDTVCSALLVKIVDYGLSRLLLFQAYINFPQGSDGGCLFRGRGFYWLSLILVPYWT